MYGVYNTHHVLDYSSFITHLICFDVEGPPCFSFHVYIYIYSPFPVLLEETEQPFQKLKWTKDPKTE